MTTGENIAKARKQHNLTQDQLAEQLGVTRQTVSKWELDEGYPETAKLVKLADVLDVTCDELLRDGGDALTAPMTMHDANTFSIDWTKLCPILGQYQASVDCAPYRARFADMIQEVMRLYAYSMEDAMLVLKDIFYHTYLDLTQSESKNGAE